MTLWFDLTDPGIELQTCSTINLMNVQRLYNTKQNMILVYGKSSYRWFYAIPRPARSLLQRFISIIYSHLFNFIVQED